MQAPEHIAQLRKPTPENPLRILLSACLMGIRCGYDGTANGHYPTALKLKSYATAQLYTFCPEEYSFGSPRAMCDIHGGDGQAVWAGKARVLTETGTDWTDGLKKASEAMLRLAQEQQIDIAVMMDISAACGSCVIYDGSRFAAEKKYQQGEGVATALLRAHGFTVISQRDYKSLAYLYALLGDPLLIDEQLVDHKETEWYKTYFKK